MIIKIFDLVTIGEVDIVTFGAGIFAKRVEASYAIPAISKDQKKHLESSRGEEFARLGHGQRCLTKS